MGTAINSLCTKQNRKDQKPAIEQLRCFCEVRCARLDACKTAQKRKRSMSPVVMHSGCGSSADWWWESASKAEKGLLSWSSPQSPSSSSSSSAGRAQHMCTAQLLLLVLQQWWSITSSQAYIQIKSSSLLHWPHTHSHLLFTTSLHYSPC